MVCCQLATKYHTASRSLPPSGMGERVERVKVRKLVGWDKNGLIGKAKAAHANKAEQGIDSLLPVIMWVFSHLQESRAQLWVMVTWEDKPCHSGHHMAWNILLVSWDQLSRLCPLPASCAAPACSLVGWGKRQRRSWLCLNVAQQ